MERVMGKYVIETAKNGEFFFNLKAGNGEKILTSETYKEKAGAKKGIESVRVNSALDARYDRLAAAGGKHRFVLKAGNHEIIGTSQAYESEQGMETGINSVKANGPDSEVVDNT
ncbi:YegP family protein [Magnetospirillum sulfuroxidans]|uniref:YegP family protein n=1 Tax=Magnetospirillum sulfuroxidans TaxID=611300 RepID=A0ABS5IEW5_9PROT|nr:YegP family protein [Magnetospirillum sulfuroxidans]MBR9972930.1 YegP family protein [Magnetospirillum sulfuroxidans]